MTRRMRRLRYAAAALCVVAQSAFTVPARVPEPPVAAEEAPADPALLVAPGGAPHVADGGSPLRHDAAMRDALADLLALDPGIARGRGEDTRVAEPSTLVLVSVGLFALILWNRRRRH